MKKYLTFLFVGVVPVLLYADDVKNWEVILGTDPLSQKSVCLLRSSEQTINDGQTTTPIRLIYNGMAFIAVTKSNIDVSYPDVGLRVDRQSAHQVDRVANNTKAVFETEIEGIRDEFIGGRTGRLTLGFWPTWPKTETVVTDFSLVGFSRAYKAFQHCEQTGEIQTK
jgi:hypothetical protein